MNEFRVPGAWRAVAASAVGSGLGVTVVPMYTLGIFVAPLSAEFGWSRAQIQGSITLITVATLLTGWLVGWLSDRHGVRPVALASQIGFALGLMLLTLGNGEIVVWYVTWLLLAALAMGTSPITWTRALSAWFDQSRGLALALGMCGSGLFGIVGTPLLARLVERAGWRAGYVALSLCVLLIALPVVWRWLHEPQKKQREGSSATPALTGVSYSDALRSSRFWLLALSTAGVAFSMGGLVPNLQPLLMDRGLAPTQAAAFFGMFGLSVILGRLASGFLLDRFWAPAVATMFLSVPAAACWLFAQSELGSVALVTAVALVGVAAGAEFDLLAYLCARYFGLRHYSQIYGSQWVVFTLFAGMGPPVFGHIYDVTHSYVSILHVACAIFLMAPAMLLMLGGYPSFPESELPQVISEQRRAAHAGRLNDGALVREAVGEPLPDDGARTRIAGPGR